MKGSSVVTDAMFKEVLTLTQDAYGFADKLAELMEAAARKLREGDSPYRIAAILKEGAESAHRLAPQQRDRLAAMRAVVEEHEAR